MLYHSRDSFPGSYLFSADARRRERLSFGFIRGCGPASSGEHCHHQLLLARHGSSFVSLLPVHPLSDQRGIPAIPAIQFLDDVEIEKLHVDFAFRISDVTSNLFDVF